MSGADSTNPISENPKPGCRRHLAKLGEPGIRYLRVIFSRLTAIPEIR